MKKAFSLVEILVAIALMMLTTGFIVAGTMYTRRAQAVKGAADGLTQTLKEAKANAQSGRKDCAACGAAGGVCGAAGDRTLSGWRVQIQNGNRRYRLLGLCNNFNWSFYTGDWQVLPSIVTINSTSGQINYLPGEGGATGVPATITFSATGVTNRVVTVNNLGEVL